MHRADMSILTDRWGYRCVSTLSRSASGGWRISVRRYCCRSVTGVNQRRSDAASSAGAVWVGVVGTIALACVRCIGTIGGRLVAAGAGAAVNSGAAIAIGGGDRRPRRADGIFLVTGAREGTTPRGNAGGCVGIRLCGDAGGLGESILSISRMMRTTSSSMI